MSNSDPLKEISLAVNFGPGFIKLEIYMAHPNSSRILGMICEEFERAATENQRISGSFSHAVNVLIGKIGGDKDRIKKIGKTLEIYTEYLTGKKWDRSQGGTASLFIWTNDEARKAQAYEGVLF